MIHDAVLDIHCALIRAAFGGGGDTHGDSLPGHIGEENVSIIDPVHAHAVGQEPAWLLATDHGNNVCVKARRLERRVSNARAIRRESRLSLVGHAVMRELYRLSIREKFDIDLSRI